MITQQKYDNRIQVKNSKLSAACEQWILASVHSEKWVFHNIVWRSINPLPKLTLVFKGKQQGYYTSLIKELPPLEPPSYINIRWMGCVIGSVTQSNFTHCCSSDPTQIETLQNTLKSFDPWSNRDSGFNHYFLHMYTIKSPQLKLC